MRRSRSPYGALVLAIVMVMAFAVPASADMDDRVGAERPAPWDLEHAQGSEFADDLWFVEFSAAPSARGGNAASHRSERTRFRNERQREGAEAEEKKDFRTLWNGMTVRAGLEDIAAIRDLPSVASVYPVAVIEMPEPDLAGPDMAAALAMTGADAAQSELGATGEGLSIAIIDTGIDYNHPDLGGDGDPDNRIDAESNRSMDHPRISHGWDYVGDEFNPADPDAPQDPAPNPDPIDVEGHGTHVAGIAGASPPEGEDGVTGVAPEVTLGAYKVFGTGSTTADVIVEALEDAYADGMDVVNMSLGATLFWGQEYPTTNASNELADRGVVVVNSAGNDGALGNYGLSAPANAHDIISVASADNVEFDARVMTPTVEGDEQDPVPFMTMSDAPAPPDEGESAPLELVGDHTGDDDSQLGCTADDYAGFSEGNVAVVQRGECTFALKYDNAVDAGASGIVMYNNVAGLFAGGGIEPADDVWAAGVSASDGATLVDLVTQADEDAVTLTFSDEVLTVANPTGGLVSSFSSYGQDVELGFGPSVMAPGGLISSTYPLASGGYAMLSGTSMSAPHVAGTVALLLEQEPDLDPFAVRDRLQNTALPSPWSLNPDAGLLDHTFRQGAGMVQIDHTLLADQHVTPGQLALGDADETTTSVTLSNRGDEDVTYTVGHTSGLQTAVNPFAPDFFLSEVPFSGPETVTVAAGSSTEVTVTIGSPNSGGPNHQFGGWVEFVPVDEESDATALRVPYSGYDGDYVEEMALLGFWYWGPEDDDEIEFVDVEPLLTVLIDEEEGEAEEVDEGHVFRPRDGEYPTIAAFFGHFPRTMEVYAVNQRSGQRLLALQDDYLSRSPEIGDRWLFPWTGRVQAGNSDRTRPVPPGEYVLEMRVLRALGDADNDAHWDTWESPSFRIERRPVKPEPPEVECTTFDRSDMGWGWNDDVTVEKAGIEVTNPAGTHDAWDWTFSDEELQVESVEVFSNGSARPVSTSPGTLTGEHGSNIQWAEFCTAGPAG